MKLWKAWPYEPGPRSPGSSPRLPDFSSLAHGPHLRLELRRVQLVLQPVEAVIRLQVGFLAAVHAAVRRVQLGGEHRLDRPAAEELVAALGLPPYEPVQLPHDPLRDHLYQRFGGERSRPFFDLVARIGAEKPGTVVDLGCGPGELTGTLAERWPQADAAALVGFSDAARVPCRAVVTVSWAAVGMVTSGAK